MKKKKYLLLLLVLLLTFGCGESQSSKKTEDEKGKIKISTSSEKEESKEEKTQETNTSTKTLVSYDKKISIKVQKDWKNLSRGELNESAIIEAAGPKEDKYLMVITDDAKDFSSSKDWENKAMEMLADYYGFSQSKFENTVVNDYSGKYVDFTFKEGKTEIYMRLYLLEMKKYYAQVYLWTVKSSKTEYSKEFYDIIKTITEVES